ncbi:hypothetical protein Noda2021_04020 [Candidatus Dependentiae bacterium Noda2021]|nr:hypothetical protein Noda2021_04020 [Candidatus Dependentiae bacterium Noda2021]
MIHKHKASRLHYDLRLEIDGVLKSWAMYEIPTKPSQPILAIQVADHPFWYRHFEGIIPEGSYGAGPVMVWDKDLYSGFLKDHSNKKVSLNQSLENGLLMIWLEGKKLKGGYVLVRISKKQRWLLIKIADEYGQALHKRAANWNRSVKRDRTLDQIAKQKKGPKKK